VNNLLKILLIFIFITNCSFHSNSKFWSTEKIKKEKQIELSTKEIFAEEKAIKVELNPNLKISLYTKPINKSFINNYDNNNGRINYDGKLKSISRFKFSKIDNFYQYDPKISFNNNDIIFFDNKGTILKFNDNSELIWKKNYYSKLEKKQKPILLFASNRKTLIVADNLSKFYALDINSGKLLWSKKNVAPFNSQIKIYKDNFFVIDFKNILRSFSVKDGSEIWNIKTQESLIRSQKKLSMVIVDKKIYFNNSLGDITSVDIETGKLLWQSPTRASLVYDEDFFLKTSDIIADNEALYFSNNKNQFFSIDIKTGTINWQQKINSNLRSTIIDNYIFSVSLEGYLVIIEKQTGNIFRITNIFKSLKIKKKSNVEPTGFIVGRNNIYLTTNNGRLLVINVETGLTSSILKIAKGKISRPSVLNQNLYIIKENSIIKLN
jgi:outer membrane protein assembly factor BamB